MDNFLTNLAWVSGVISTLWFIMAWVGSIYYNSKDNELQKMLDNVKEFIRTYPKMKQFIIAVISWCWILSK